MKINDRISALRSALLAHSVDAIIIPSSDPHQSEYVADHWQARVWFSGFTGSAGTVVVTKDHAGLWTDSRYFIQAEQQLANSEFELHRLGNDRRAEHIEWLLENLPKDSTVICDGYQFSQTQIEYLEACFGKKDIKLRYSTDLIDSVWKDRPSLPSTSVIELTKEQVGLSREEKIQAIRTLMIEKEVDHLMVSTLDDLSWILNLRGRDIPNNPVTIAYLIVHQDRTSLYIDADKLNVALIAALGKESINVLPYSEIEADLKSIPSAQKVWINPKTLNGPLYQAIQAVKYEADLPSTLMKAIKNEVEIENTRFAMKKDGVALVKLFRWLETTIKKRPVSEVEVSDKLITFRKEQSGYFGESFPAIVGYKGNGAIIHYRAEPETCAEIKPEGILLLDSGGQYTQGTTDITRTVALGPTTAEQRKHFTAVLKGHIALDSAIFPKGTPGRSLDLLTRQPIWKHGVDYGHGTGHGVGFFLNVHEGPQSISYQDNAKTRQVFLPGMITSNEPGFYLEGAYGIRIENLILCKVQNESKSGTFYNFETLTMFPIDLNLVESDLLNEEEKSWLKNYHEKVYAVLSPALNEEEKTWLAERCK